MAHSNREIGAFMRQAFINAQEHVARKDSFLTGRHAALDKKGRPCSPWKGDEAVQWNLYGAIVRGAAEVCGLVGSKGVGNADGMTFNLSLIKPTLEIACGVAFMACEHLEGLYLAQNGEVIDESSGEEWAEDFKLVVEDRALSSFLAQVGSNGEEYALKILKASVLAVDFRLSWDEEVR